MALFRHKISLIFTLSLWLVATGAHWDLIQAVAWGKMLVVNARQMSLDAAVVRTFSPEGMCGACHAVQDAKRDGDGGAAVAGKVLVKDPLILPASGGIVVEAPTAMPWHLVEHGVAGTGRAAPPVPPPKVA
ncbi:MAG: hypothetical protein IAE82_08670 [Opitutaceae bacterium]|nr:hypothetical protein [Opitutaceae bacterium]